MAGRVWTAYPFVHVSASTSASHCSRAFLWPKAVTLVICTYDPEKYNSRVRFDLTRINSFEFLKIATFKCSIYSNSFDIKNNKNAEIMYGVCMRARARKSSFILLLQNLLCTIYITYSIMSRSILYFFIIHI